MTRWFNVAAELDASTISPSSRERERERQKAIGSRGRENMFFNLFSIVKKFLQFFIIFISLFIRLCGCWCRAVFGNQWRFSLFFFLIRIFIINMKRERERVRLSQAYNSFACISKLYKFMPEMTEARKKNCSKEQTNIFSTIWTLNLKNFVCRSHRKLWQNVIAQECALDCSPTTKWAI